MRPPSILFGSFIALLVVGGPLGYRLYEHRTFRNFRAVRPGVLYRSGQLTRDGLMRLIHDFGIRTVIALRDPEMGHKPTWDEERFCSKEELYYFRLSPKSWWPTADGPPPAEENVRQFLEILDDPKYYPVLVHCFAGTHRTGAYCAIYQMEYEHASNDDAIQELFAEGYDNLFAEDDVRGFLKAYVPRWKK